MASSSKSITTAAGLVPIDYATFKRTAGRKRIVNAGILTGIIGILVSLIGIPVAFIVARRGRQVPDLRYVMDFDVILNPEDGLFGHGLSMTVGHHPINSISRTRVALWNHRGDTIRGSDIVDSDPLRVQFADNDVALQVRTLCTSRQQTKIVPTVNQANVESIDVNFDFLDASDGAIFEIIHLGPQKPAVLGTIRGAKIRNRGNANLGPNALASFSKSILRGFLEETPLKTQVNVLLNFTLGLLFTILAISFAILSNAPSHLADVSHYNLRTITGQAGFANAVQAANPTATSFPIYLAIAAFIIGIYFFSMFVRSFRRSKFPASIVNVINDYAQGEGAGTSPDTKS